MRFYGCMYTYAFSWHLWRVFYNIVQSCCSSFFYDFSFFYENTVSSDREGNQILKVFLMIVATNALYFVWNVLCETALKRDIVLYFKTTFSFSNMMCFILWNESPFSSHLWYLNALLYIYYNVCDKKSSR